ncbi:MAG: type II toxin-antitoxin system VapC family toxin [Minisyncoccia bacterium]
MKYLLNANAVIGLLGGNAGLLAKVHQHVPEDFGVSAIAAHELFYGAYKSQRRAQNLARIDGLQFVVLEFDQEDARQAGEVRAALAAAGTPIGPYDVLIAGQARARGLILVTHNTGEFSRVGGLDVEDWQT